MPTRSSSIYGEGIATGVATFDTIGPDWRRLGRGPSARLPVRRPRSTGQVVGWTALAPYSAGSVYAGVAWESVYVTAAARGQGIGAALLARLLPASERAGIWTLMAGIQVENAASLRLHERVGLPADRRPAARRPGRRRPLARRHAARATKRRRSDESRVI